MKKLLLIALGLLLVVGALLLGPGFTKRTDVYVSNYAVSEDGTSLSIRVNMLGSMGFIRDCTVKQDGAKLYVGFYCTFGGLNSSFGARNEFDLALTPDSEYIYFERGEGSYELELQKNPATGQWERAHE